MGTSSTIAILKKDGTVEQVSAHYDGNLYNTGATLLIHYSNPHKVKELIALGDLSALKKEIHPPIGEEHTFNNPIEDVTRFYGRDRGESSTRANKFNSYEDYLAVGVDEELNYIFDEKKEKWFHVNPNQFFITDKETKIALQPLAPLVKAVKDLMPPYIEDDYIIYIKQLKNEREYKKLQKELNNQQVSSKKMKI